MFKQKTNQRRLFPKSLFIFGIVFSFAFISQAQAATYYVENKWPEFFKVKCCNHFNIPV